MSPLAWLLVTGLTGAVGLLTAVMSALLERSGLIRLRHWAEEAGGQIERLYLRKGRFEVYRLLLSLISRLSVVLVFALALKLGASVWLGLTVATVMVLVAEMASRFITARGAAQGLLRLSLAYRAAMLLLAPLVALLRPVFPFEAMGRRDETVELDEASEGEIEAYISVGQREGILEPGEELLVKGVVEFGDTLVKSVMTPRIDMVAAPLASPPATLLDQFLDSGHSRLPLYGDSADEIIGVLHLRDLVTAMHRDGALDIASLARPAFIVPETKPIAALLRELQARHQQLAIVVDEFGGTAGVATVEDLLEEIVGDIADEHEEHDPGRLRLGEGVWLLDGSCAVEELEELFAVELDDPPYETVGGLVFATLGHVPERGETVRRHGLEFEVRDVRDRRVRRVRVQAVAADAG